MANFEKAISKKMINWRYFTILDKSDVDEYAKHIELSKQIIKLAKQLYEI